MWNDLSLYQLCVDNQGVRIISSQVQCVFIVICYLTSCSYLACQNDVMHKLPDSPVPEKLTLFCLIKCFCNTWSVNDNHLQSTFSVKWWICGKYPWKNVSLHESLWGNFLSEVDCHMEVYINQWKQILKFNSYLIHLMHELKEPNEGKRLHKCESLETDDA
jgi:hypothetical protein